MVVIYVDDEPRGKVLDKNIATSIMVEDSLLQNNPNLKMVAACRDNKYYQVTGTETVIMHVEEGFCILCDNKINGINLPLAMQQEHYAVYQSNGRDWVKNSATSRLVGYDIKEFVHGYGARPAGMTLDHEAETFDERERNKKFSSNNVNEGSHRVRVMIYDMNGLDDLIDKIKARGANSGALFLKKKK